MAEEQDAPVETFDQYSHSVYSPITPGAHMDSYKVSLRSPRRDGFVEITYYFNFVVALGVASFGKLANTEAYLFGVLV